MAKCVLCGRKGLFLKVNPQGYCKDCIDRLAREKQEAARLAYLKQKQLEAEKRLNEIPLTEITLSNEARKRQTGYDEIKTSNITPKGVFTDFVVFDTETTGLTPSKDRIIELGAIKFIEGKPVEKFHTLINPERTIPVEVTQINHITDDMVQSAPTISEVLPAFEQFVGNSNLVAHNLEFDLKFLFYSGCKVLEGKRKYFDTIAQAKRILKVPKKRYDKEYDSWEVDYDSDYDVEDYKLSTLCDYYNITIVNAHRADADALATGDLFLELVDEKQA